MAQPIGIEFCDYPTQWNLRKTLLQTRLRVKSRAEAIGERQRGLNLQNVGTYW